MNATFITRVGKDIKIKNIRAIQIIFESTLDEMCFLVDSSSNNNSSLDVFDKIPVSHIFRIEFKGQREELRLTCQHIAQMVRATGS
jgi:hypothetical protein